MLEATELGIGNTLSKILHVALGSPPISTEPASSAHGRGAPELRVSVQDLRSASFPIYAQNGNTRVFLWLIDVEAICHHQVNKPRSPCLFSLPRDSVCF